MMIAELVLDNTFHVLTFKYKNIYLSFQIPEWIKELNGCEVLDSDGYVHLYTNAGDQGINLLYDIDGLLSSNELEVLRPYMNDYHKQLNVWSSGIRYNAGAVAQQAYMVFADFAVSFEKIENKGHIRVRVLKSPHYTALYRIEDDGNLVLRNSNMAELELYKSLALVEKNREELLCGYEKWVHGK